MANEISVVASITEAATGISLAQSTGSALSVSRTGTRKQALRKNIGTTEESIAIDGEITAGQDVGYCIIWNRDDTNFLTWGVQPEATDAHPFTLRAGEVAILRGNDQISTFYFKADTAACDVEIFMFEA